jgi:nucleotidyltransferase-like protein
MRRLARPGPLGSGELKDRYEAALLRAVSKMKQEFPNLVGIQVHGSVARGEPGPFSDIDLLGITSRGMKSSDFSYFDGDIYVGMGFLSVAQLKREFSDPKAFFWGRGSAAKTRILHDPKDILRRILVRWKTAVPSNRVVEDGLWEAYHNIIEYSGKLRNGWAKQDQYLIRYSALVIARHVERALVALNGISIISENYLWDQILEAKKKPKHMGTDYPLASGLKGSEDTSRVYRSALRLCRETLRLVKSEYEREVRNRRFRELLAEPLQNHGL